jgi:Rrf2 family protein
MKISKKCEYALRAILELSKRNSGEPVKIHVIAKSQGISGRFLEVILNELRHGGFVESRRGNEGGYLLAQNPEDISVGQVIECIEGPIAGANGNAGKGEAFFGEYALAQLWERIDGQVSQMCYNTTFSKLAEIEIANKAASAPNYSI